MVGIDRNVSPCPSPIRMVPQPARRPASMSRQRSPIMKLWQRSMPYFSCARNIMPGFGLRHSHSSLSSCSQTMIASSGRIRASRLLISSTSARRAMPRRHAGLISDDDQHEAMAFQHFECGADTVDNDKFANVSRRTEPAISKELMVEHAVAIEEDGRSAGSAGRCTSLHRAFLLHVVRQQFGWPTMLCHTTAWRPSSVRPTRQAKERADLMESPHTSYPAMQRRAPHRRPSDRVASPYPASTSGMSIPRPYRYDAYPASVHTVARDPVV